MSLGRAYIVFEANGQLFEMMGHITEGTLDVEYSEQPWPVDMLTRALHDEPRIELTSKIVGDGYRMYTGQSPFQQPEVGAHLPEVTDG